MSRITKINLKGVEYDVGEEITVDSALSTSSTNPVQNKVVKAALDTKQETVVGGTGIDIANDGKTINHSNSITARTTDLGSAIAIPQIQYDAQGHITAASAATVYPPTTAGTANQLWQSKGNGAGQWCTPDTTPMSGSNKPVTSGAVYTALQGKQNTLTIDTATSTTSTNPVQNKVITAAVNAKANSSDVYTKSQTYTKAEVNALVDAIPKFAISVVTELPAVGAAATIYLLKTSETETGNLYTEYIYTNNAWEKLGTQTLDLSGYATTSAMNTALANKVDKVSGKGLSTNDYTTAEKNKLAGIETGANKTVVDSAMSTSSINPVQNKIITTAVQAKSEYWVGSASQYSAITTKIDTTIYFIAS